MRTGTRNKDEIVTKTLASVSEEEEFAAICVNPPDDIQTLDSALRFCALKVDRKAIRKRYGSYAEGIFLNERDDRNVSDGEDGAIRAVQAYYTDRRLRSSRYISLRTTFRGHRRGMQNIRGTYPPCGQYKVRRTDRVPHDACMICFKKDVTCQSIPKL